MAKIKSNTIAASDAISKIVDVKGQGFTNQSVSLGFSNVKSMTNGVGVSNAIIADMSRLISCVYGQADKIQQLAAVIEQRDLQDSLNW